MVLPKIARFYVLPGALLRILILAEACSSGEAGNSDTLEIGIGIGIGIGSGGSPPLPPCSPPLSPDDFPNLLQYQAYLAIQRFKKTITSDPNDITRTWVGRDLTKYRGFFLDNPPSFTALTPTVASVDFNGFRLSAPSLSGFLDSLPHLALFHANSNAFSGALPALAHLPFLYELDLSNNQFSGQFPPPALLPPAIAFLDLRYNRFQGPIPPSIFPLVRSAVLFLNNNEFSQTLPADLGRAAAAFLTLANNAFVGSIPSSIGDSGGTLVEALLLGNRLSGCLPAVIGKLRKATVFDAGFNEITGPIPPALGCMESVEQLSFAGNLLYGEVPDEVCRLGIGDCGRLINLSLSGNYFTSLGESCRDLLRRGILSVERNCIPGCANQRSKEECARFTGRRKLCPSVGPVLCGKGKESCASAHSAVGNKDTGGRATKRNAHPGLPAD